MAVKGGKTVVGGVIEFIKVIISIILAILVLSIGLWSFAWITGIDAMGLLQQDSLAVGIVVAGMLIAIAIILGPTIASVRVE